VSWIVIVSLVVLICAAVWTVLTPTLLLSAIGLAATSGILALVMYQISSPYAAVFELSVCAGLITVVFVSAISHTRVGTAEVEKARAARRIKRFIWLPVRLAAVALAWFWMRPEIMTSAAAPAQDVRSVLWGSRRLDILGQLILILAGVFGVVLLFKAWDTGKEGRDDK